MPLNCLKQVPGHCPKQEGMFSFLYKGNWGQIIQRRFIDPFLGVFRDVVFQDVGFENDSFKPLTHISFRCEVPTSSVFEGQSTIMIKPHILKHRIPELPTCWLPQGNYGWIAPDVAIEHESAKKRDGDHRWNRNPPTPTPEIWQTGVSDVV